MEYKVGINVADLLVVVLETFQPFQMDFALAGWPWNDWDETHEWCCKGNADKLVATNRTPEEDSGPDKYW